MTGAPPRLNGKRALVTAAGQGIGRAVALAFARAGATVLAIDINSDSLTTLRAEDRDRLSIAQLDVTDRAAIAALGRERSGATTAFNVLCNCVGLVHAGTLLECTDAELERSWEVNVVSMYRTCKALLPGMIAAGGGSIINVSSVASSVKAVPNRFAYSTTKAAVIGLTKSLAMDFIDKAIRCNAICPGTVQTPSLEERIAAQARAQATTSEAVRVQFESRQPMGRLGRPEEVAALAVYLASDEAAFTTGAIHIVDGGWCN